MMGEKQVIMSIAQSTRVLLNLLLNVKSVNGETWLRCLQSATGLCRESPTHCHSLLCSMPPESDIIHFSEAIMVSYMSPSRVGEAGITAVAAYLEYEWRKNAAVGVYRNNLLIIITFRQVWETMG